MSELNTEEIVATDIFLVCEVVTGEGFSEEQKEKAAKDLGFPLDQHSFARVSYIGDSPKACSDWASENAKSGYVISHLPLSWLWNMATGEEDAAEEE